MRLLLSADWQIGARFRQFGERAAFLRAARVRTLRRALALAVKHAVDAFIIAGDLFEDHQIAPAMVAEVFETFAEHSEVPIVIVPGNHDPIGSPGAIWARPPFATPPPHITVCRVPEAIPMAGGWLLASPLTQKHSTIDPSLGLVELARGVPTGAIKVGITHGSPAIESRHQADDFPIALDAAARAGLDLLVLGHWHNASTLEGGRTLMTGTPEPDDFAERLLGAVHLVEVAGAGAPPGITALPCAELQWKLLAWDLGDETRSRIERELAPHDAGAARTVLRATLRGLDTTGAAAELASWLRTRLAAYAVSEVRDETVADFSAEDLAELSREHPVLAGVLEDLRTSGGTSLEKEIGAEPGELSPELLAYARRLLLQEMREAPAGC